MPVTPGDFSTQASNIDDTFVSEISNRTVIILNYYCAFHYIREQGHDAHPDIDFTFGGSGSDHRRVIELLEKLNHQKLAKVFLKIKERRAKANYDIHKSVSHMEVQMMEYELNRFLSRSKKLFS